MSHLWAVILGIAQGVAEFLPISSTAHLRLIPWLFGIEDQYPVLASAQFDIALHLGSFVAIVAALWRDWYELFADAFSRSATRSRGPAPMPEMRDEWADAPIDEARSPRYARMFLGFLLVTSIPGALFGVLFDEKIETYSTPSLFHWAPVLVGSCLIIFGIVLYAVDRLVKRAQDIDTMTWGRSFIIGLAQAFALVPGVSRSGATMTAGRALGLSRDATAKYSFMAAAPIIGGAALFGLRHVPLTQLFSLDWVLGFVASAISSVLLMRWMLNYVRNHSFAIFMWYRIVVGTGVIVLFFFRG